MIQSDKRLSVRPFVYPLVRVHARRLKGDAPAAQFVAPFYLWRICCLGSSRRVA